MALIEGVDDEVTLLFALLLLVAVIFLAWVSTHTSDRSAPYVVARHHDAQEPGREESSPSSERDDRTVPPSDTASPEAAHITEECITGSTSGYPEASMSESSEGPTMRHRGEPAQGGGDQGTITLRLKFLNDTERAVTVRMSDTILHIKRSQFPGQEPRVRLIYQGQLLRNDSQTVATLQLTDGCVLHCHVSQHDSVPGHGVAELDPVPLNVGSLLVPVLGLVLCVLWYCQFQYPQFFTATATACLGVITLMVTVIAFSSHRR